MQFFFHEGSNCHDTYVNIVNDKIAAITFAKPEDFKVITSELKLLSRRLRNLVKELSDVESNAAEIMKFIENTKYQSEPLNELVQLIDPDLMYVYPAHLKNFVSIILIERIKKFRDEITAKFATAESKNEHLLISQNKQQTTSPIIFKANRKKTSTKLKLKLGIEATTMEAEYNLILMIIVTEKLIENKLEYQGLVNNIYDSIGLYRNFKIIDETINHLEELEIQKAVQCYLWNLKEIFNGSYFTIEQFLKLDINARWFLITNPSEVFGDQDNYGINPITVEQDTLQIFIECKQALAQLSQEGQNNKLCLRVFKDIGLPIPAEDTPVGALQEDLNAIAASIAKIIVPFAVDLNLYESFDLKVLKLALFKQDTLQNLLVTLQLSPVKLLQLPYEAFDNLLTNSINIAYRCEKSGISLKNLLDLPADEITMIFCTKYYIDRLPVLTRAYFLTAEQFLTANFEQKQAWLKCPAETKLIFNNRYTSIQPIEINEALLAINNITIPILNKLVATEALLYIKELINSPWLIVSELQKGGLRYNQCRAIFKILGFLNKRFIANFINRFTNDQQEVCLVQELKEIRHILNLRFIVQNVSAVYEALESYIISLVKVLDATKGDKLPSELCKIIESKNSDDLITNLANNLNKNNVFCKHLRLYKTSKHEALLKSVDIYNDFYVSLRYSQGDVDIFQLLEDPDNLDFEVICVELEKNSYDIRNTQELSLFGYASETRNLALINIISSFIKSHSERDIQKFLIINGFNKPSGQELLFTFNQPSDLTSKIINEKHPVTADTPLLTAIRQRNSTIALGLIIWGAALEVKDLNGLSPVMLAIDLGIESIVLDIMNKQTHMQLVAENMSRNSASQLVRL